MSLTVSRTPLRITLGGGGSDLAADGLCVAAAINLYTYVVVNRNRGDEYILKYSDKVERVKNLEDVQHPLIHACLAATNTEPGVEIDWLSDVDSGMGLGSSASFVVGTLMALDRNMSQDEAAAIAIEIDTGWQDQWACAKGGVRASTKHMSVELEYNHELIDNLVLIKTGMTHCANDVINNTNRPEQENLIQQAKEMIAELNNSVDYEEVDIEKFGKLLNSQRIMKFSCADTEEHREIERTYNYEWGLKYWKLVGAGNGGCILTLDNKAKDHPYEIPFSLDGWGSVVIL